MIPRTPRAVAAWVAFALALALFLATMNRTVGFGDRGELAATAYGFGVPHPTGYPTLMLLAGAVARLAPFSPILALNALAALLAAAAMLALVPLLDRVLARATVLEPRPRAGIALGAALFAASTATWWQQGNGFEVYALHVLWMPVVVLAFLRFLDAARPAPGQAPTSDAGRRGLVFSLLLGLAATNHVTIVLVLPGLLIVALARLGVRDFFVRWMPRLLPGFLLGLAPYGWLLVAAQRDPAFAWGDTRTLPALVRHVTGDLYGGWIFSKSGAVALQARYLLIRVPWDLAWVGPIVCGLGLGLLAQRTRALAGMALAFVLAGLAFTLGYPVSDPDPYLLTTVLGATLALAAGLARVHERLGARVTAVLATALVFGNVALHLRDCDESRNRLAEGFVIDLLGPLPEHSLLFTEGWEIAEAPALYFQQVEGFRRDVTTVNSVLTRRGWYLDQLRRREPELIGRVRVAFDAYRAQVAARERSRGIAETKPEYEARVAFLDGLAAAAMVDRPVFAMTSLPEVRATWQRVPWRLAILLTPDTSYVSEPDWSYAYRPWRQRLDTYTTEACWAYGSSRTRRADYEARHGHGARATARIAEARVFDPGIRLEQVTPLALGTDSQVLTVARFFRGLDAARVPVANR